MHHTLKSYNRNSHFESLWKFEHKELNLKFTMHICSTKQSVKTTMWHIRGHIARILKKSGDRDRVGKAFIGIEIVFLYENQILSFFSWILLELSREISCQGKWKKKKEKSLQLDNR